MKLNLQHENVLESQSTRRGSDWYMRTRQDFLFREGPGLSVAPGRYRRDGSRRDEVLLRHQHPGWRRLFSALGL